MASPSKAKAKNKARPARRVRRSDRAASNGVPSWAASSPGDKKKLDETIRRVLDGTEKLNRILL